jgi:hypothetical protein
LEKKEFDLEAAFDQFWLVWENADRRSHTCIGLYFYLCKVWNTCGRPISFRRQNTSICAELSISKPTLDSNRNWLKQAGLIDFHSKGKGDSNITYEIINVQQEVKKIYFKPEEEEVKKAKNFTSSFTTSFTTSDDINSSKELLVVVEKGKRFFKDLKILFEADEGLRRRWLDNGYKHDDFTNGLEYFFQRNHGKPYEDFKKLRDHIFNWIPKYAFELKDKLKNETNRAVNGHRAGKTKGGSITELQSLKQSTDPPSEQRAGFGGAGDDPGREGWQEAEVLN